MESGWRCGSSGAASLPASIGSLVGMLVSVPPSVPCARSSFPNPGRDLGSQKRAPPVVCSGVGGRAGAETPSPLSTPACSPDSWTRRAAAFQGCRLGSSGVRRIALLEPSVIRKKSRGAQLGTPPGRSRAGPNVAALHRVHSELYSCRPAQSLRTRSQRSSAPARGPKRTLSGAQTAHRPGLPESEVVPGASTGEPASLSTSQKIRLEGSGRSRAAFPRTLVFRVRTIRC